MTARSACIGMSWIVVAILSTQSPTAARADCELLRKFNAVQANGFNVVFNLSDVVNGKASGSAYYLAGPNLDQIGGQADATFDGVRLIIDVRWHNGSIGHYEGRIDDSGHLSGATRDLQQNPRGFQARVNWVRFDSKQRFACGQARPSPSADVAKCRDYARTAVQQNGENIAMHCEFTGARWDSNAANHENWCRVVDPALPASESVARAQDLTRCRAMAQKAAEPPIAESLPRAGRDALFQVKP